MSNLKPGYDTRITKFIGNLDLPDDVKDELCDELGLPHIGFSGDYYIEAKVGFNVGVEGGHSELSAEKIRTFLDNALGGLTDVDDCFDAEHAEVGFDIEVVGINIKEV